MTSGDNFNFFAPNHTTQLIEVTADMTAVGVEHDMAMNGMSTAQQAVYMGQVIKGADAVFAVFNISVGPLNKGLLVIKGADVLAGAGVKLKVVECRGKHPALRSRRLNRTPKVEAFLCNTYEEAIHMDFAWGDSIGSVRARRWNRKDGGEQAVSNMREAVTPDGRNWLAANPHLWNSTN